VLAVDQREPRLCAADGFLRNLGRAAAARWSSRTYQRAIVEISQRAGLRHLLHNIAAFSAANRRTVWQISVE